MTKIILALGALLISTSAFASSNQVTLEDVQTRLAPYIPQGRSVREMSGLTTYGGGATCMSSISIKPDEVEFSATWGDSGTSLRLSEEDQITMEESANQIKISILKEGLPSSVTLTFNGQNVEAMHLEETYKSLFFKRHISLLCSDQVAFIPKRM